jgi:hypothetical protein
VTLVAKRRNREVNMVARCCLSLVLVLAGSATPAIAQQGRANPYGGLFKPRDLKEVARMQQAVPPPAEARAGCGVTKVPVSPGTDPKVAKDPSITHYTMRVLPPGCR